MKEGCSTFGAAKRFGKPLYMGKELRKEQSMMNSGTFGQGMYTIMHTHDGKPLNLGKCVKHPTITGFGTAPQRPREKNPLLQDQGPAFYDVHHTRRGLPLKLRPDSTPAFAKSMRGVVLYEGKEHVMERGVRGLFGPGNYDVKCDKHGTPLKIRPQSTPSFGKGERWPSKKLTMDSGGEGPSVLDPEKSRAFGKQPLAGKRSSTGVTFGNSTRDLENRLFVPKAFYSTPPNVVRWVDPRS